MASLNYVTSILFCIGATAATYLVMHLVVSPRLPVSAADVPPLAGLTVEQGRAICDPRGLLLVVDGERVPEGEGQKPGTLFDQHPVAGSRLRPGEKVHVSLALAQPRVRVPALGGQAVEAAQARLKESGLGAGVVTQVISDTVASGLVVRTQPEAGAEVRKDQTVELIVSKGSEQVAVPNLRGRSVRSARQLLEQAGLALGQQRQAVDDNADDGAVLRQTPAAGTLVPKGQKVDLVVNE